MMSIKVMKMFKTIKGLFKRTQKYKVIDLGTFSNYGDWDTVKTAMNIIDKDRKKKARLPKNPIDIVHDLEVGIKVPTDKIRESIKELKRRIKFIKNTLKKNNANDEERALDMLKARLRYPKHAHMFRWKTTTDRHIRKMLDKYKLEHRGITYYMRNIPPQAITSMDLYAEILKNITKEPPEFSLIAPEEYFKNPRNDPILLAKSPFGAFYYILGAWDKEISIVTELLDDEELVIDKGDNVGTKHIG